MEFLLTLRRRGIADKAVLRAMDEVPRERFVDANFVESAYADQALPIECGQTISQPYVVAYMTERLGVQSHHRVLEIGTGSGYQAAVLSRLTREVVSIERYRTLADRARAVEIPRLRECRRRHRGWFRGRAGRGALRSHHCYRRGREASRDASRPARRQWWGHGFTAGSAGRLTTSDQAYQVANRNPPRKPDPRTFRADVTGQSAGTVIFQPVIRP